MNKLSLLLIVAIAALFSCSKGGENDVPPPVQIVSVTGVELNTSAIALVVNSKETLTANVIPANATNKNVTWSSSNTTVATVKNTGEITAVSIGTSTIVVSTIDGGKISTCTVIVTAAVVAVTGVSVNKSATTIQVGRSETIIATVAPANATNKSILWTSSNSAVANVNDVGVITAISSGTTIITATTVDGGKAATCYTTINVPAATISTNSVTNITITAATSGGNVTSDGGSSISAKGVCWSTNPNPTILDNKTTNGAGLGSFSSLLTELSPNTTYYVRAYATNANGTTYGNQQTFITLNGEASITTKIVISIALYSAMSGGNISNDGGSAITARGVCWATNPLPTINDSKTSNGTGAGSFTSSVSGLLRNTTYYIRAYATNDITTSYGGQWSFTTLSGLPTVITNSVKNITPQTVSCSISIPDNGGSSILESGVCWALSPDPQIEDNHLKGSGDLLVLGLTPNTTYYIRAYATNIFGMTYGNQQTFTTASPNSAIEDFENNEQGF